MRPRVLVRQRCEVAGLGRGEVVLDAPAHLVAALPEAHVERIVDALLSRPSRTGSRRTARGTGLGLAVARGLARAHGGDVVHLAQVSGGCFELRLPYRPAGRPTSGLPHPGADHPDRARELLN